MTDSPSATFRVRRFKQGDAASHFDRFNVPVGPRTTVLDGLVEIRKKQDPTLTLRHSCFHASCGTCGMRVNGREVLACVTNVTELDASEVVVEPLANAPLVSDLVVDMSDFYARFNAMERPLVQHSELVDGSHPAEGIDAPQRYEDCIECGICVSACPITATDPRYAGPAALAASDRVRVEPRGADVPWVLGLVDSEHGAWRCHAAFECSEACPSSVDPAAHIMRLRRSLMFGARADAARSTGARQQEAGR
jgi:succinate dehydrogenase / fumarate reductase iron-sulfur subunit